MFIPGDFGRPLPSLQMTKNITNTFLGSSLYPVTTVDSNSIFKVKVEEFQFETPDGVYIPDIVLKIPRTPLLLTDPSTYISVSPFTESNIRKYHSAIGNLNHDTIKNPLSLKDIKAQYKPDQLPLGSQVNPLISDFFKPVHLTPGCIAEIVSFVSEPSPSSSGTNFNNFMGKATLSTQKNNKMKLWGGLKKAEEPLTNSFANSLDLKQPKSSLARSSSTFITKVTTTDGLSKKLNSASELMVAVHGRFLNVINLNDDFSKIEIDIPYVRVLFTVGVITTLSTFTSSKGSEKNLDIVIGFSSGDLVWINPFKMKYSRFNKNAKLCNKAVTAVEWSPGGRYICAGFANGEVMVFNRDFGDDESYDMNSNMIKEQYVRYYKTFDEKSESNPVIHFQTSHKPITSIKVNPVIQNIWCITSDDGYVKIMDIFKLNLADIFPSYYGGLLCSEFSSDGNYLLVGGEDDFISVYELMSSTQQGAGNLRLLTRLEGSASWIRNIKIDNYTSEANLIYRISAVGDDGDVIFWEFLPRDLPKIKIPLHHRSKTTHSPNLKTVNSGIFQQQRAGSHRRKISNLIPTSTGNSTATGLTPTRHKHAGSISSLTSGQQQQHLSILQAMNSHSQASLLNQGNDMKSYLATGRRSLSRDPTVKFSKGDETVLHEVVGLAGVPILKPISVHEINLGRLSGIWFDKKYIWVFTSGGDLVRWIRPATGRNASIKNFI